MAKTKKNIGDFKEALRSNTKVLNQTETDTTKSNSKSVKKDLTNMIEVDPVLLKKIKDLATKEKMEVSDVANSALKLFLNMKDYLFEK